MAVTESLAVNEAIGQAVLDHTDAGTGPGKLVIFDNSSPPVDLLTLTLSDPMGTQDSGNVNFYPVADGVVANTGTAHGYRIEDSDGNLVFSGSVSTTPPGTIMNSLDLVAGQTIGFFDGTYVSLWGL